MLSMTSATQTWLVSIALASVPLSFAWAIFSVGRAVSKWIEKKGNK